MPAPYQARRYIGDVNVGTGGDPVGFARFAAAQPAGSKYQLCDGKPSVAAVNSANAPFLTQGNWGGHNDVFVYKRVTNSAWATGLSSGGMYCNWMANGLQFAAGNVGGNWTVFVRAAGNSNGAWTQATGIPTAWVPDAAIQTTFAYAFGKWWMAVTGVSAKLYSSNDGYTWSQVVATTAGASNSLSFCDGVLWYHNASWTGYTSDGTSWTQATSPAPPYSVVGKVSNMVKYGTRWFLSGTSSAVFYTTNPYNGGVAWTQLVNTGGNVIDNMQLNSTLGVLAIFNGSVNNFSFYNASTLALIGSMSSMSAFNVASWANCKAVPTDTGFIFYDCLTSTSRMQITHLSTFTGTPAVGVTSLGTAQPGKMAFDDVTKMLYWNAYDFGSDYACNYYGNCVPTVDPVNGLNCYIKLG